MFSMFKIGSKPALSADQALPRESTIRTGAYRVRLATTPQEQLAAYRLRFLVFNLELDEGLASAFQTGHDVDAFDPVCDHIIAEHVPSGEVIGTYRVQTGATAAQHYGYYSAQEFDFTPYEPLRDQVLELGRACVHRDHRSFEVLTLLWRGIARYALEHGSRYLVGCSSLTSQDVGEASAMYHHLSDYLVEPALRTVPVGQYAFDVVESTGNPKPPKLLRTYLAVGAKICGPPAIDREFKTIDFLTLMDLEQLPSGMRARLFS